MIQGRFATSPAGRVVSSRDARRQDLAGRRERECRQAGLHGDQIGQGQGECASCEKPEVHRDHGTGGAALRPCRPIAVFHRTDMPSVRGVARQSCAIALDHNAHVAFALVSRFRRSYPFAARSHTNVGTKGTLATL